MQASVALPLWLVVILTLLAAWSALDRLLVPSVRWVLRRRVNRAIEEINQRLRIAIPQFQLTKRRVLIDRLLYDPQVALAVADFVQGEGAKGQVMPREVAMARVEGYAKEIVPSFNAYAYFRIGYWIARGAARLLYRVRLGSSDEAGLAAILQKATVVFLMNHRSNMDYVLVSYLVAERIALSYAVGEWARVWPLQQLIKSMGAYFVRRNSRDPLYRRVLERYIQMATEGGVPQAVFPEGGLSRDGLLRPPRIGILDYMLRTFDPQGERDLVFVPVGLNYDRTLEDRTLLLDTLPERPPRRSSSGALATTLGFAGHNLWQMARQKWHRFGYACVNFGTPFSTRAHLSREGFDPRKLPREERIARVEALARVLMAEVGRVIPALPASLVATALLAHPEGRSEFDLKADVHALISALESSGARVYVPRSDRDYAISFGLRTLALRHLVAERDGLFAPVERERPL
ncbi:MAG TPA: 1-acyl-sn-glycerol-3-phosphate acyltransferase, partial [Thermoanaerobaculia bacterium]|nr:1-acyl-sn-glycerol-3-phosphate acyltransferase [Thermoanaerobaculia bacterium]